MGTVLGQHPIIHYDLIAAAAAGIVVVVLLVATLHVNAFVSLVLGAAVVGVLSGFGLTKTIDAFQGGFGATVASTGILIGFGAMLGRLLADSGGAEALVGSVLRHVRPSLLPWALCLVSFLLSIPLFFEVGVVLILPPVMLLGERSARSLAALCVPVLASITLLNGFLLPHPGPLTAVTRLGADFSLTLLLGVIVAIPTLIIGGPLIANLLARGIDVRPPPGLIPDPDMLGNSVRKAPSPRWVLVVILLPVVLMLAKAFADVLAPAGTPWRMISDLAGQPLVALLAGLIVGMFVLGIGAGLSPSRIGDITGKGLPAVAGVILIVAAGGGFGGVLKASGIGEAIGDIFRSWGIPLLMLGWIVTAIIRIAVGSGTVAIVTAVGLLEPLAQGTSAVKLSLLVLAIGAGSRFLSHVNDAGFWLVKEYMGLSLKQTFRYWTLLDCIISVSALASVLLLDALLT